MELRLRLTRRRVGVIALLAGLVSAGVAYATIPDANGVFTACMLNKVGTIRIIDPATQRCSASLETQITWNQGGPKGPVGDKGPTGDKGATGDQGPTGDAGPTGLPGDKGPPGDEGPTGKQGLVGDKGPVGDKGSDGDKGPVGDKGPTGDPGPAGASALSGYEIIQFVDAAGTSIFDLPAGGGMGLQIACPAGKRAVNGGFRLLQFGGSTTASTSAPVNGGSSWRIEVVNQGRAGLERVTFFAICANAV